MKSMRVLLAFAMISMAATSTASRAQQAKGTSTLPAAICSLDSVFQLISIPTAKSGATSGNPGLAITDQQKITFLADRISACKHDIANALPFAKSLLRAQVGNIGEANCEPLSTDVFALFNQLERCVSYETALAAVLPAPTIAFHAARPVVYVIMNSPSGGGQPSSASTAQGGATGGGRAPSQGGAGNSPGSGGSQAGGGSQGGTNPSAGSGGATASTGTGGIDNSNALLLYDIAIRLNPPGHEDSAFVIPSTQWSLANYYSQCLADPPRTDGSGTYGALLIDPSTTTNGGQFALLVVNGWSYVKYSVTLLKCQHNGDTISEVFPNNLVWHGYAEGKSYRSGVSFLPIGIWLTYQSTKWVQAAPTITASTSPTFSTIIGATTAGYVLSYFLGNTSGITLGDTGTTMTVPRAYDNAAGDLRGQLQIYCGHRQSGSSPDALCKLIAAASSAH